MAKSVDFDASKGVEQSAADVFLRMFWTYAVKTEIPFREFRDLVETWHRIRDMETLVESIDYKKLYEELIDSLIDLGDPAGDRVSAEPREVQIDQHTFVSEKDAQAEIEALKAEADKGSEAPKPGSWAKRELDRKFKQAVVERIREARKMGIEPTVEDATRPKVMPFPRKGLGRKEILALCGEVPVRSSDEKDLGLGEPGVSGHVFPQRSEHILISLGLAPGI